MMRGAGTAVRAAGGRAVAMAGRAAVANPVGLVITGLIAAGIVALRLGSGKTFEQMGDEMNNMLLGDLDEAARAKMTVRNRFQGDAILTRIRSQSGKQNVQMNRIAEDLFRVEKQYEDGKALIQRELPVNGTFDMLILRAQEAFSKAWKAIGGDETYERVVEKATKHQLRNGNKRMGR
jgi:hypothetical protein